MFFSGGGLILLEGDGPLLLTKVVRGGPPLVSGGTIYVNKIGPGGLVLGGPIVP